MKIDKETIKWLSFCAIGGIVMLFGIASGLRILSLLLNLYKTYAEAYVYAGAGAALGGFISFFVAVLFFIITGGGFSILAGCGLVLAHLHKIGRKFIALGSGIGAIGMFIYILYLAYLEPSLIGAGLLPFVIFVLITLLDPFFIGALLTIVGRKKLKAHEKELKQEKKEEKEALEDFNIVPAYERRITCSLCGVDNPRSNRFCSKCGNLLESTIEGSSGGQTFINY